MTLTLTLALTLTTRRASRRASRRPSRRRMRASRKRATCGTTPSSSSPRWIRRASTHRALHGTEHSTTTPTPAPLSSPLLASTHAHPPAVAATVGHRGDVAKARPTNGCVVRELITVSRSASRAATLAPLCGSTLQSKGLFLTCPYKPGTSKVLYKKTCKSQKPARKVRKLDGRDAVGLLWHAGLARECACHGSAHTAVRCIDSAGH